MRKGALIPFDKQRGWYCEKMLWWWNWGQAWSVADSLRYWLLSANNATYIGRSQQLKKNNAKRYNFDQVILNVTKCTKS